MNYQKLQALAVALFPVLLTIGIIIIPLVTDYSDHINAGRAAAQTGRWFWGHIISSISFGVAILAACFIAEHLYRKREIRGLIGLPLVAIGAALYAGGLGADGIGPLATEAGGNQAHVFFDGSGFMIGGVFTAASIVFGIGLIIQITGVVRARLVAGMKGSILFIAALLFIGATAISSGWGLYGVAAAALLIYLPISIAMWRESKV